ncbi:unnamed protein product [Callosobruchus maculatus]|uniref:Uncharacterized protein n=1 Tax=Callosobruchus maculatus TaxID=64391 RepID=A0A653D291_CALMS|nr:unnamed protein product [Callosobruchus maculatus]
MSTRQRRLALIASCHGISTVAKLGKFLSRFTVKFAPNIASLNEEVMLIHPLDKGARNSCYSTGNPVLRISDGAAQEGTSTGVNFNYI